MATDDETGGRDMVKLNRGQLAAVKAMRARGLDGLADDYTLVALCRNLSKVKRSTRKDDGE